LIRKTAFCRNFNNGTIGSGDHSVCILDSLLHDIPMRWRADTFAKFAVEMTHAQTSHFRQRSGFHVSAQIAFDMLYETFEPPRRQAGASWGTVDADGLPHTGATLRVRVSRSVIR
jgi:hypothetical protein